MRQLGPTLSPRAVLILGSLGLLPSTSSLRLGSVVALLVGLSVLIMTIPSTDVARWLLMLPLLSRADLATPLVTQCVELWTSLFALTASFRALIVGSQARDLFTSAM
jgi:hypothetical protein